MDLNVYLRVMAGHKDLDAGTDPRAFLQSQVDSDVLPCFPYLPYIEIANQLDLEHIDQGYRVMNDEGEVKFHFRVRTKVLQEFDLTSFPFDSHDLVVHLRIPRKADMKGVRMEVDPMYGMPRPPTGPGSNTMNEVIGLECMGEVSGGLP